MEENPPTWRWFRFNLRTLFVLVTLSCIICSYFGWALNWKRQREKFLDEHTFDIHAIYWPAPMPLWPVGAYGYQGFSIRAISRDKTAYDQMMKEAERLFPEAEAISYYYSSDDPLDYYK